MTQISEKLYIGQSYSDRLFESKKKFLELILIFVRNLWAYLKLQKLFSFQKKKVVRGTVNFL